MAEARSGAHWGTTMKSAAITLRDTEGSGRWVRLSLSLGEDVPAGRCSFIENDFSCNVRLIGTTDAPVADDSKGWVVLVLSGARYVFSYLKIPHKTLIVHQLKGCLDVENTLPIADASAMCLLTLLGMDASQVHTEGWRQEV
jgi:hypothetical protein